MPKYLLHLVTTQVSNAISTTYLLGDGGHRFLSEHKTVEQHHFRHFVKTDRIETETDVRELELEVRKDLGFPIDEMCVNIVGWKELS